MVVTRRHTQICLTWSAAPLADSAVPNYAYLFRFFSCVTYLFVLCLPPSRFSLERVGDPKHSIYRNGQRNENTELLIFHFKLFQFIFKDIRFHTIGHRFKL